MQYEIKEVRKQKVIEKKCHKLTRTKNSMPREMEKMKTIFGWIG